MLGSVWAYNASLGVKTPSFFPIFPSDRATRPIRRDPPMNYDELSPESPDFDHALYEVLQLLLPLLASSISDTDHQSISAVLLRHYARDVAKFQKHVDYYLAENRNMYSDRTYEDLRSYLLSDIYDRPVHVVNKDGTVTTMHGIGVMCYAYEEGELRKNELTEAECEQFRDLLMKHYFDDSTCTIRVVSQLVSLNSTIVSDDTSYYDMLHAANSSRSASCRRSLPYLLSDADDYPEIYGPATSHQRILAFTVTSPAGEIAQRCAALYSGLSIGGRVKSADNICLQRILESEWGRDMQAFLTKVEGSAMRYFVTEPKLIRDLMFEMDEQFGVQSTLIEATRLKNRVPDNGAKKDTLIASFGLFHDPLIGYAELRTAFALKSAPNTLWGGAQVTIGNPDQIVAAAEEIVDFLREALPVFGIEVPRIDTYFNPEEPYMAEPNDTNRLYCTSTGKVTTITGANAPDFFDRGSFTLN